MDAVAFDPDPITGGKIVIQAKRYTRTVGVSAVRDLYGTVMNEGASRGILVTTADYGPDAYSFANGKPLTLMNGANLLHMMQRHGQKAKIDLKEARALLAGAMDKNAILPSIGWRIFGVATSQNTEPRSSVIGMARSLVRQPVLCCTSNPKH